MIIFRHHRGGLVESMKTKKEFPSFQELQKYIVDYMIQSLQVAKDEIEYAEKYIEEKNNDKEFYQYGHFGCNRIPNGTVIRESLKMVGRMANIAANNVCLSPYNSCIFKE